MAKADVAVAATLADPRYMQAAEVTGARREHLAYVFSSAIDVLYFRRYHDTHCRCVKRSSDMESEIYKRKFGTLHQLFQWIEDSLRLKDAST
ncbi:hypothetical protein DY000_02042295 [Brassica cretica]|uniref:Uncharacterized protein n=1 Tax=Brassica cretica TaxID=69181 RepID=A0ABQ7B8L4_BRACR|nr:hypothetical protein DY000_02042295 [Brassica cretica]